MNKNIKKESLKKDLMNLNETNYQMNISYHSVSNNNTFKSNLSAKSFSMFQHCSRCAKHGDYASVSAARLM